MKENQVFFSCCNPNTAQKQLKGEWVCFDLGFASGVLFLGGKASEQMAPWWLECAGGTPHLLLLPRFLPLPLFRCETPIQSLGGPQFVFLISSSQTFPKVCVMNALNPVKLTIKIPHHCV